MVEKGKGAAELSLVGSNLTAEINTTQNLVRAGINGIIGKLG